MHAELWYAAFQIPVYGKQHGAFDDASKEEIAETVDYRDSVYVFDALQYMGMGADHKVSSGADKLFCKVSHIVVRSILFFSAPVDTDYLIIRSLGKLGKPIKDTGLIGIIYGIDAGRAFARRPVGIGQHS